MNNNLPIIKHWINGGAVDNNSRYGLVFNPSLGEATNRVAFADQSTLQQAVSAAKAALPAWRQTAAVKRARIMFRYKELLEQHSDELCRLISLEHGKVLSDAAGELQRGIENVEYACYAPELLKGEHSREVGSGTDSWSEFHSLGVVAGITPFNFPVMVPLWMWPLAVVCGNTFILKPSEKTPSSSLRMVQLAAEAGLPAGVLNLLNGDKEVVDALLRHPEISAISFVGSTSIAEIIYQTGSAHGKRVQALGGAKNHAVVMADADIDNTITALMGAAYGSCGERCMAVPIVIAVGDTVADQLIAGFTAELEKMRVGDSLGVGNDMGPLVSQEHYEKILSYIASGIKEGAVLKVDGRLNVPDKGYFLRGTLFDRVNLSMQIAQDEIFGPVLAVMRVENLQQALAIIAAHPYGNGTCIFTRDGQTARLFSEQVEVGMVGVNVPLPVPVSYHSFGGWKRSLFGALSIYGPDGVRFYTKRKTISQRWPDAKARESVSFNFPGRA